MASKKKPSWQFYPGDWMKDPGLRSVSSGARGIWIDMLCLMFECDRRGFLLVNGKPASLEMIARMTGNSSADASRYLTELETSGVFSRTSHGIDGEGCIYSRRMVRDEANKKAWGENGKKGGNPKLKKAKNLVGNLDNQISNQNGQGGVNQKVLSSSSTSVKKTLSPAHACDREGREGEDEEGPQASPSAYLGIEIPENLYRYAVEVTGWLTPDSRLKALLVDYPSNWILQAMTEAALSKKNDPRYIRKILSNWKIDGGPPRDDITARRNPPRTNSQTAGIREAPDFSDVRTGEKL